MADLLYVDLQCTVPPHRQVSGGRIVSTVGANMTSAAGDGPANQDQDQTPAGELVLPDAVWQKLQQLASAALPAIPPAELPRSLRRFARFTPAKRAKLAASPLRHELETNEMFRQRVAEFVQTTHPKTASAISASGDDAPTDVFEAAAFAYLLRPKQWRQLIGNAMSHAEQQEAEAAVNHQIGQADQRAAGAEHDKAIAEREAEKLRVELREARSEAEDLRRRHHQASKELRELKRRERKTADTLSSEQGRLKQAEENHRLEMKRLTAQRDEAIKALERARRGAKDTREFNESRMWLLLETLSGAAHGLRRELALEPAEHPPAHFIADTIGDRPASTPTEVARGLSADDPIRLDELLALPQAHMVVDGYNVTIGGFGDLTLEQQRARLIRGLSGLAAQTGAEMTVVFDGADRIVGLPAAPRGVRVLFSRKGQTADEVIRTLVRNEPNGRPVVVISSDKEVADGTRRHGAYPLSSDTLLRRLARA